MPVDYRELWLMKRAYLQGQFDEDALSGPKELSPDYAEQLERDCPVQRKAQLEGKFDG